MEQQPETSIKAEDEQSQPMEEEKAQEMVYFTLNFKKEKIEMEWDYDDTIANLKKDIEARTHVPVALQKLMYKGLIKNDNDTLRKLGVKHGDKLMLIGSTMEDVIRINTEPDKSTLEENKPKAEVLSDQAKHKKILEKGPPDNAMPGIKGKNESLPKLPLSGILNNRGTPVRLTFKLWTQELWISSSSSTQRIPFASIRNVTTEPIKDREEYHIVTLQMGATVKYFLYFVPAQYTKAIITAIMGYTG